MAGRYSQVAASAMEKAPASHVLHKDVAVAARHRHRRVRDRDLREALARIEQAFGSVTVLAARPTPPDRRHAATAASANGRRSSASSGSASGAGQNGQICLDLTAIPGVGAAPPAGAAGYRDGGQQSGDRQSEGERRR